MICSGSYRIYGQSDKGKNAGRLVIENSLDSKGAAIRLADDTTGTPTLYIDSGELEINGGSSQQLVDGVKLSSTSHIHQGTLDGHGGIPRRMGRNLAERRDAHPCILSARTFCRSEIDPRQRRHYTSSALQGMRL